MTIHCTQVGIAIVEFDSRYLVGRRPDGAALGGMHEFPGGKCRPDESPRACAVRECAEETGLCVTPVELLDARTHAYPHGSVELHFWRCVPADPLAVAETHNYFAWLTADELAECEFPEANTAVLKRLGGRGEG